MNLKYIKIISFVFIFIFSFLAHFMYDWFPNTFISFFFPVNESIWEHMKILYTSILVGGILEFFLLKKYSVSVHNFMFSLFISAFSSVIIYLGIYLPVYYVWGENLIFSILLMAIVYAMVLIFSYYLMSERNFGIENITSILFLILGYVIFIIFTYIPCHNYIFYDVVNECYRICEK